MSVLLQYHSAPSAVMLNPFDAKSTAPARVSVSGFGKAALRSPSRKVCGVRLGPAIWIPEASTSSAR